VRGLKTSSQIWQNEYFLACLEFENASISHNFDTLILTRSFLKFHNFKNILLQRWIYCMNWFLLPLWKFCIFIHFHLLSYFQIEVKCLKYEITALYSNKGNCYISIHSLSLTLTSFLKLELFSSSTFWNLSTVFLSLSNRSLHQKIAPDIGGWFLSRGGCLFLFYKRKILELVLFSTSEGNKKCTF
jgi:hypothetical protein